jgi:hypothetical protein
LDNQTQGNHVTRTNPLPKVGANYHLAALAAATLALLLALRHTNSGRMPDALLPELSRTVLEHPSFLTPELLEAAAKLPRP